MSVDIFERKDLQFFKCLVAHIAHYLISNLVVAGIHKPLHHSRDDNDHRHLL